MDNTEVLLTIKDFEQRYKLTRSNIYNRINGLKDKGYQLEPMKQGTRSIFSAEQGAIMDRLHNHLLAGNDIGSFPDSDGRVQMSQPVERSIEHPIERITTQQDSMIDRSPATLGVAALVDAIAGKLAEVIPTPQPDPLADLRRLQEACDQGWLLSTSQLAPLLGLNSLSGQSFERYGFTFTRTGRNGTESAWKINKLMD
jgi:hypothetical protein